jgi:hypothetical protein
MAAILPNSIFIHVPKTGGTFVRRTLKDLGIYQGEYPRPLGFSSLRNHVGIQFINSPKKTFAFVRSAASWLQSKFANKVLIKKQQHVPNNFGDYVRKILDECPDAPSRYMISFIGYHIINNECVPKERHVDFVGRTEHLREHLIQILDLVGETYDKNIVLNKEEQRVASRLSQWKDACKYPPGLEDKVIEANLPFTKVFGENLVVL